MGSEGFRKKFLFIDDEYVVKVDNLQRKTNQAVKHPKPIMKMDAPWDTKDDEYNRIPGILRMMNITVLM